MAKMAAHATVHEWRSGIGVQAVADLLDQVDTLPENIDTVFDYRMTALHSSSDLTTGMNSCLTAARS